MHKTKKSFNLTPSPRVDEGELRSKRVCPEAEVGVRTKNWNSAFTLVELIVVIVILAILSTIAFLSFNSYSTGARDSVRLGDLNNISKGLVLFYTNSGRYPIPDNYITITASGTNIGYQGYAGLKTLGIINLSNGGKDPLDTNTYYTYNTNINQNKYQLMGFLEDGSNSALSYILDGDYFNGTNIFNRFLLSQEGHKEEYVNQIYSDSNDYSKRYPYIKGDQLGILLNSGTQLPIQYNNSNTGFELTSATGTNYIAYISKSTIINSTGSMIGGLAGFYTVTQASSTYPGCDTPDIKLSNGQVWAACNVGASRAWNNQVSIQNCLSGPIDCSAHARFTIGSYFQWGRNDDVTNTSTSTTLSLSTVSANSVGHNSFIINTTYPYYWQNSPQNDNIWGGSGTTSTGGTYYTQGQPSSMQGPCANGYHIPTQLDWIKSVNSINPSILIINSWQNDKSLVLNLRIPFPGFRYPLDGTYNGQGSTGYYWTASVIGIAGYALYVNKFWVNPLGDLSFRGYGFSVRCLRN